MTQAHYQIQALIDAVRYAEYDRLEGLNLTCKTQQTTTTGAAGAPSALMWTEAVAGHPSRPKGFSVSAEGRIGTARTVGWLGQRVHVSFGEATQRMSGRFAD